MYRVLVSATNYSKYCARGKQYLLENGFQVDETKNDRPYTQQELLDMIADYDAAIVGCDSWGEEVLSKAHKLKAIARFGVGIDNLDLEAAKRHGVHVTYCPGINSNSVSEHAIMLMLAMERYLPRLNETTRQGMWERVMVHEINACTIGLLGFGNIARKVAEKLQPFHPVKILAYDAYPNYEEAERLHVTMCDLETVLSESDIVSIHVPSIPETHHLICDKTLAQMKPGAYLINTARGPIVDEEAAARALASGQLGAMASDVFESDPVRMDNPLLAQKNFICTPHTAAESYEVYDKVGYMTAEAVVDILNNRTPVNQLV